MNAALVGEEEEGEVGYWLKAALDWVTSSLSMSARPLLDSFHGSNPE
jgi:hypothetical protein